MQSQIKRKTMQVQRPALLLALLLLAALLLAACGGGQPAPTEALVVPPTPTTAPTAAPVIPIEQLYETLWVLVGYGDAANPTVVPRGVVITAEFTPDGAVGGSSGCNNYNAAYSAASDGTMTIGPEIASTMMACPTGMDEETAYLSALTTAASFSFSPEGRLEIVYDSGEPFDEKLVFASGLTPLTNTTWVLVSSGDTDQPEPLTPGVIITAVFGDDGTISGSSGCNTYATSYTLNDSQITINPVASTMMACPTGMDEEAAYLTALGETGSYEIAGSRLSIFSTDGSKVLNFTAANLPLENTLWELVDIAGAPPPDGVSITALFQPAADEVPATVGGSAGCNNYNAGYTLDGDNLAIETGISTMMFCEGVMDLETAYLEALGSAQTYQILGQTLVIHTGSGDLTYTADRTPLVGALWVLSGMGDPENLTAPVQGANFTAQFTRNPGSPSGVVAGTTGCNEYSAAYTANLEEIKVNLPEKTKNESCAPGLLEQEQQFFLGLNNAGTYNIQGNSLVIPYDEGKQVLVFYATQVEIASLRPLSDLNGTTWFLHAIGSTPVLPGTSITARFAINPDGISGSLDGSAGCNSYVASFGESLGVTSSLTSRATCATPAGVMQQEQNYLQTLSRAFGFWLTGDQLVVNTGLGALTYRSTAPDASRDQAHLLQGQNWFLVSYDTTPAVAGSGTPNLFFDPNGALTGFTGCNSVTGSYQTELSVLTIANLNKGNTACPDEASAAQETAFMNGLSSSQTYQVASTAMQIVAQTGVLNFSSLQPDLPGPAVPAKAVITAPSTAAAGQLVTFDGSKSESASPIIKYSWDFGDGGKASGVSATHAYQQAGSYTVRMTVENQTGFQNTATQQITIEAPTQPDTPPTAAITGPSSGFVGEPVAFSAAASTPGTNPIASYAWSFGDGSSAGPSPDAQVTTLYDEPGTYQVSVTVADANGLSGSASLQIVIDARLDTDVWTLDKVQPGTAITLQFLQGQLVGFAGCNTYSGNYTSAPNEDGTYAVTVSELTLTQISCPELVMEQEADYLRALQAATTASIQGNILSLAGAEGALVFYQVGTPRPR